jgi:hypothetical protein
LKLVLKGLKNGPETMTSTSKASKDKEPKKPSKLKHNMNRDKFKTKDVNEDKEYCDADTLK